MYAVIFKAKLKNATHEYQQTAIRMRELAITEYGCREFVSTCEDNFEVTISYWENLEQIQQWKQDKEHINAQKMGKSTWYESYTVQITEIQREYTHKF